MKRMMMLLTGCLLAATVTPLRAETRALNAHDLWSMERVGGPQVSPDGEQVAFVLRRTDFEANRGRTDIWLVGVDGSGLRQLTRNEATDVSPLWARDGTVLFLSSRSGSMQVWRIDPRGGEAEQITDLPLGVGNLVLSPDGERIAFTLEVFPDCDGIQCTADRLEEVAGRKATGRTYDALFVRHWDSWKDGRRSRLFVLDLSDDEPVEVTRGLSGDVPSKPFGGAEEITFSPSGMELVFAMREGDSSEAWSTDFDLYVAPVDGSTPARLLTGDNSAWDTHPVFTPDGRTLAYLAMQRPGYESDRFRLVLRDWSSGEERVLTEDWDRSVGSVAFSTDSRTAYVTAADVGQVRLFAIDMASGAVTKLVDGGHVRSPAPAGDRLVFGLDHLQAPVELFTTDLGGRIGGRSPSSIRNGSRACCWVSSSSSASRAGAARRSGGIWSSRWGGKRTRATRWHSSSTEVPRALPTTTSTTGGTPRSMRARAMRS